MKKLLNKITDMLADAALLEMGVDVQTAAGLHSKVASETWLKRLFQNVTDTLADAALLEMGVTMAMPVVKKKDAARADECRYGDSDMCLRRAA